MGTSVTSTADTVDTLLYLIWDLEGHLIQFEVFSSLQSISIPSISTFLRKYMMHNP